MDFAYSEEQEMIRRAARDFAENLIEPCVEEMETKDVMPESIIKGLGEYGFLGLTVPSAYDGSGLGNISRLIVLEEIGRISSAVAMSLQVMGLGIAPLLDFGNEEQKTRFLPALARGEKIAGVAATESTGGSEVTGCRTTARLEGDSYILNGRKVFITNAELSDVTTVLARMEGGEKPTFSCFLVEKGMPGFKAGRKEHKVGMKGCETGELVFQNCLVPKTNLLGKEGDGLKVALKSISEVGRAGMIGCALGIAAASLEEAVKFAKSRVLYGKPISNLQAIQFKIADMKVSLEAARLLGYKAAWLKDQGQKCDADMAYAKAFSTEAALKAAAAALEIHGGYGCMMEFKVQRLYRDAALLSPSAGTSDIMRVVAARTVLG